MLDAPFPDNEPIRIDSLRKTQLLDSPLEERFERITRLACRLLGVPIAAISLVDTDRQWFKSVQGMDATETPRKVAFCAHAILNNTPMIVPDATKDDRFQDNPLVTSGPNVVFYAGQPLKSAEGVNIGVLCAIDNRPREFSDDDLQTLRDLASLVESELRAQVATSTQKDLLAQLDEASRRAMVDPMTRLWNREGILEILAREHAAALRNDQALSVLLTDVDCFKGVNDTHGHAVGDDALKEIAKRLLSAVRPYDSVGRFGGEEFLVVAPVGTGPLQVAAIAMRLCQRVNEAPVRTRIGNLAVTISVGGVKEVIRAGASLDDLIKKADEALYRAKRAGRNRAEIAA